MMTCSSCKKEVSDDYVRFKCPGCGKVEMIRCAKCRETAAAYRCPECKFVGP